MWTRIVCSSACTIVHRPRRYFSAVTAVLPLHKCSSSARVQNSIIKTGQNFQTTPLYRATMSLSTVTTQTIAPAPSRCCIATGCPTSLVCAALSSVVNRVDTIYRLQHRDHCSALLAKDWCREPMVGCSTRRGCKCKTCTAKRLNQCCRWLRTWYRCPQRCNDWRKTGESTCNNC